MGLISQPATYVASGESDPSFLIQTLIRSSTGRTSAMESRGLFVPLAETLVELQWSVSLPVQLCIDIECATGVLYNFTVQLGCVFRKAKSG